MIYSNFCTQNIALWLSEDSQLYSLVRETEGTYKDLAALLLEEFGLITTPDLESFHSQDLNLNELDRLLEMIRSDFDED